MLLKFKHADTQIELLLQHMQILKPIIISVDKSTMCVHWNILLAPFGFFFFFFYPLCPI